MDKSLTPLSYSVVIPIHNEEGSLCELLRQLAAVMEKQDGPWEIIAVNDHSTDTSLDILKDRASKLKELVIIDLKRRCGKSLCLQAGFDHARGAIIITLDADLQNDPADIPKLLAKLAEGFDLVYGRRLNRQDPWLKVASSRCATGIRRVLCKDTITDVGSAFWAFRRKTIDGIFLTQGLHRFFSYLLAQRGYRVTECPVNHRRRAFGISKYSIGNRLWECVGDLIRVKTGSGARRPLHNPYEINAIIRR